MNDWLDEISANNSEPKQESGMTLLQQFMKNKINESKDNEIDDEDSELEEDFEEQPLRTFGTGIKIKNLEEEFDSIPDATKEVKHQVKEEEPIPEPVIEEEDELELKSSSKKKSTPSISMEMDDEESSDGYDDFDMESSLDIGGKVGKYKSASYENDEDEPEAETETRVQKNLKGIDKRKLIIIIGVATIVLVILGTVLGNISNKGTDNTETNSSANTSVNNQKPVTQSNGEVNNTIVTPTPIPTNDNKLSSYQSIDRGFQASVTSMELKSDEVYDDTIDINKFIEIRGGVVIPKFKGVADHLGKEIEFVVDMSQYNKYVNGVKLSITYSAILVNGELYVTNVQLKEE